VLAASFVPSEAVIAPGRQHDDGPRPLPGPATPSRTSRANRTRRSEPTKILQYRRVPTRPYELLMVWTPRSLVPTTLTSILVACPSMGSASVGRWRWLPSTSQCSPSCDLRRCDGPANSAPWRGRTRQSPRDPCPFLCPAGRHERSAGGCLVPSTSPADQRASVPPQQASRTQQAR
jgi:hypothetical protein